MSQGGPNNAASATGVIDFVQGNSGGPVGPDAFNTIFLLGSGTIAVTGNAGTNTLTISDMDAAWTSISASQTLAVNTGYFCVSPGGALSLLLPPVSSVGAVIEVAMDGAASFTITQGAGQVIVFGNQSTTVGVGGSIASTGQGDTVRLVCRIANLRWVIVNSMGNPDFV